MFIWKHLDICRHLELLQNTLLYSLWFMWDDEHLSIHANLLCSLICLCLICAWKPPCWVSPAFVGGRIVPAVYYALRMADIKSSWLVVETVLLVRINCNFPPANKNIEPFLLPNLYLPLPWLPCCIHRNIHPSIFGASLENSKHVILWILCTFCR